MWSDIGAIINLLLGFTFITVFETLVFLYRFIAGRPENKVGHEIPHVLKYPPTSSSVIFRPPHKLVRPRFVSICGYCSKIILNLFFSHSLRIIPSGRTIPAIKPRSQSEQFAAVGDANHPGFISDNISASSIYLRVSEDRTIFRRPGVLD